MKILSIGSDRNLFKKNSAVRNRSLEYAVGFEEFHVVVFTPKGFENLSDGNLFIYPTNSINRWFYVFDAVKIGIKIIKNSVSPVDFIVTTQDPFESGLSGWMIARKFKIKLYLQVHTDFLSSYFKEDGFLNKIRLIIASLVIPKANGVRVVSERIKDSIIKKFNISPAKISVLPIFVDVDKIRKTKPSFDLHDKYPQFDFIVLMVCRLEKEKNLKLAVSVMKNIITGSKKIGLVIVGDGSQRLWLESFAKKLSIENNIIFEGWQNDLVSYYKTADLFLSTSNYEGYGMSLVEAIVSQCPIVTTDVGIVGEILNKENSFICPVEDEDCLVKSIREARRNKTLLTLFKLKAGNMLKENSIENYNVYLKSYKKILSRCL